MTGRQRPRPGEEESRYPGPQAGPRPETPPHQGPAASTGARRIHWEEKKWSWKSLVKNKVAKDSRSQGAQGQPGS